MPLKKLVIPVGSKSPQATNCDNAHEQDQDHWSAEIDDGRDGDIRDSVFFNSRMAEGDGASPIMQGRTPRPWVPVPVSVNDRPIASSTVSLTERDMDRRVRPLPVHSTLSSNKSRNSSLENLKVTARSKLSNFFRGKSRRKKGKLSASAGSALNGQSATTGRGRSSLADDRNGQDQSHRPLFLSHPSIQTELSPDGVEIGKARLAEPEPSLSDKSAEGDQVDPDLLSPEPIVEAERSDQTLVMNFPDLGPQPEPELDEDQSGLKSPKRSKKSGKRDKNSGGFLGLFRRRVETVMPIPFTTEHHSRKDDSASVSSDASDSSDVSAMKSALFNVAAFGMAACCIGGCFAAYYLFYDFVKPALWAIICGIVLHPLKRRVTTAVRAWLDRLSVTGTPLSLGVVTLPLAIINRWGDFLLDAVTNNLKTIFVLIASFPTSALLLHLETVPKLLVSTRKTLVFIDKAMGFFKTSWVPLILVIYVAYVCVCNFLGRLRSGLVCNPVVAWTIWIAGLGHACSYFGPLRTLLFSISILLCTTYYIPIFRGIPSPGRLLSSRKRRRLNRYSAMNGPGPSRTNKIRRRLFGRNKQEKAVLLDKDRLEAEQGPIGDEPGPTAPPPASGPAPGTGNESSSYLKKLFIVCFFVYVSLHLWIILILIIPIGLALIRRMVIVFHVNRTLRRQWDWLRSMLGDDAKLILPPPLVHLLRAVAHIDRQIIYYLRHSMDFVGSLTAMLLLTVGVALVIGFVAFQLYHESLHLVTLTSNIANQTLAQNPGLQKWLRDNIQVESVADLVDQGSQRAFVAAKTWLSQQVHEIVENDPEKAAVLETQIITTLDALFERWLNRKNETSDSEFLSAAAKQQKTAVAQWSDTWAAIRESGGDLDWNFLDNLQEYLSVAWSVADSAWLIIKNNMEVLTLAVTQIASAVLASGTAVIDFFLDSIVFLTFLLYVLSESDDEYKPFKMIREMIPGGRDTAATITEQVEEAVNGVFFATSKIAIFYGLLTWLTHTLFAVNLVFIPTVLAALFAAIPFLGAYVVALPAVLELWIIRGEPFLAGLLFAIHFLPVYVVDDAIYSEITLTTPLLSGMAIAGGILWWGLEGAIFGPLVLCFILVLGGVYKTICFQTISSSSGSSSAESSRKGSTSN